MLLLYSNVGGGGKFVDRKPVDYSYYFHINYTHNSVRKKNTLLQPELAVTGIRRRPDF